MIIARIKELGDINLPDGTTGVLTQDSVTGFVVYLIIGGILAGLAVASTLTGISCAVMQAHNWATRHPSDTPYYAWAIGLIVSGALAHNMHQYWEAAYTLGLI